MELTILSPLLCVPALETPSRHAGRRFGAAFCVVIMLALYQLGTSGLLGIQDGMPAGVRGVLLGGLAALLLPLLFLWPGSGGLLIRDAHKGCCGDEESVQHPGDVQSPPPHLCGAAAAGRLSTAFASWLLQTLFRLQALQA